MFKEFTDFSWDVKLLRKNLGKLPDVELVLAAGLDQVLVAADTGGLHRLAGQLLQLVRDLNNDTQID